MRNIKKILVLTADAGFGHRSAANAIAAALNQKYGGECEVVILNPLADKRTPAFLRDSEADYDYLIRKAPELYRIGYNASNNELPSFLIESLLTLSLYEVMRDMVHTHNPDAIVTTYPLYSAPLISYFTINHYFVPLITVVTDLVTVHQIWFSPQGDLCLVPTRAVEQLALDNGIQADRIKITGIPVSPVYAAQNERKPVIRARLGWNVTLPTYLVVGSRRTDRLLEILNVLNHFGLPLQVIVLAGKDTKFLAQLEAIDWHIPAKIFGLVENMTDFMLAADAIICKAGGLIITESLACGLPIMLMDVIPGQEEGNRDYVLENDAGVMVETAVEALEVLAHWLADDARGLKATARKACLIGMSNSALDAANLIWQQALRGPTNKRGKPGERRTFFIDLLTRNNIPIEKPISRQEPENGKI